MMIRLRRAAAAAALLVSAGCATTLYEGQTASVTLDSDPRGATAYLVPISEWTKPDGSTLLDDPVRLENYRVREGTTPVIVSRVMHRYEYVAALGSKKNHVTMTPGMVAPLGDGRKDTVLLSLAGP